MALSQLSNRTKAGQEGGILLADGTTDARAGCSSRIGPKREIGEPCGRTGVTGTSRTPLSVPASCVPIVRSTSSQPVLSKETRHVRTRPDGGDYAKAKKNDQQATARVYDRNWGQLWNGCTISCLFKGSTGICDDMEDLGNIVNWIHEWGMGDYARQVVRDVEDFHTSQM